MTESSPIESSTELGFKHPKRSPRRRRVLWWLAALLILGWALPAVIRLNYLKDQIASALSANLGRPVHIGDVHPHLISGWDAGMGVGVGVEINNVEIADDPRFGVEPLARIETLEARLAIRSLWHRRLEFSHVVLRNPSVNLVRAESSQLNLVALIFDRSVHSPGGTLSRAESASGDPPIQYPDVRIVDGRLNFKMGNRKKSVHLTGLDVDLIAPKRPDQPWRFKYSGIPSRASFEQPPAFVVHGSGQIGPFADGVRDVVPLKFDWRVQDALLGEVANVLAGSNHGTHGVVSLSGEALGTTALLRVSGRSTIKDLHRWDVILLDTVATEIPAEFSGVLDWHDDAFQLTRFTLPLRVNNQESGRIELRGRIERISSSPSLLMEADARNIPLAAIAVLAEPFAIQMNPAVGISGTLGGHLNMHGMPAEWTGEVDFTDVVLSRRKDAEPANVAGKSRLQAGAASVRIVGGKFESSIVKARFGDRGLAEIKTSGDLSANTYRVSLRSNRAPLADIVAWMPEAEAQAIHVSGGSATVNLEIAVDPAIGVSYNGRAQIVDTKLIADGMTEPVEIANARIQLKERNLVVRPFSGKLLGSDVRGNATVQLAHAVNTKQAEPTVLTFDLQADSLDFDHLAAAPLPEKTSWLSGLMSEQHPESSLRGLQLLASGKLKADRVRAQGFEFTTVTGALDWREGKLRLTGVSGSLAGGRVNGSLALSPAGIAAGNLATAPASLEMSATFRRVDAERLADGFPDLAGQFAGELSGKLELRGSGSGWEQVWQNLSGGGEIVATGLALHRWEVPDTPHSSKHALPQEGRSVQFADAKAKFEVAKQAITLLQFEGTREIRPDGGPAAPELQANGTIGFNKSVQIVGLERSDRSSPNSEYRWTGTLAAPKLEDSAALARNAEAPR